MTFGVMEHVMGEVDIKKTRRRIEDKLRKCDSILIVKVAKFLGVPLVTDGKDGMQYDTNGCVRSPSQSDDRVGD